MQDTKDTKGYNSLSPTLAFGQNGNNTSVTVSHALGSSDQISIAQMGPTTSMGSLTQSLSCFLYKSTMDYFIVTLNSCNPPWALTAVVMYCMLSKAHYMPVLFCRVNNLTGNIIFT